MAGASVLSLQESKSQKPKTFFAEFVSPIATFAGAMLSIGTLSRCSWREARMCRAAPSEKAGNSSLRVKTFTKVPHAKVRTSAPNTLFSNAKHLCTSRTTRIQSIASIGESHLHRRFFSSSPSPSNTSQPIENVIRRRESLFKQEKERQNAERAQRGPVNVTLLDGPVRSNVAAQTKLSELIPESEHHNPIVAVRISLGGEKESAIVELSREVGDFGNSGLKIVDVVKFEDPAGQSIFWHSSAHILGGAVEMHHFPQFDAEAMTHVKPASASIEENLGVSLEGRVVPLLDDGPPLSAPPGGFYYDFYLSPSHLGEDAFTKVQKLALKSLVKRNLPFERLEVSRDFARDMFSYNPLKLALLDRIPQGEAVTVYRCGAFVDLCRGPHLASTGLVSSFHILRGSGAYWRGNNANPYLQRIYGISFPTEDQFESWKRAREEAERRDHRNIGRAQQLFMFHEYSPGSPFFLPHGTKIFNRLVNTMRAEYVTRGYDEIITPLIFDKKLWKTSGHWTHYRENMFLIKGGDEEAVETSDKDKGVNKIVEGCGHDHSHHDEACEDDSFSTGLKPMNCPGHCLTFKAEAHSYRDLPIRYSDFSSLHRNEARGTLTGLTRVRRFHQDDAHIFCTPDQIEQELKGVMEMVDKLYGRVFDFPYEIYVSTRPQQSMGTDEEWKNAEEALMSAVKSVGRKFVVNEGDGAFYGPKIDFIVTDALSRKHQCATIQLDFQLPQRFELQYVAADGSKKTPVIIHRAIMGSIERMFAMLCEHYAGKWPLWLSPRQVAICAVSEKHIDYANKIFSELKQDFHSEMFIDDMKLQNKIRLAQTAQFNYILVIGNSEMEEGTVSVRMRDGTLLGTKTIAELKSHLNAEIEDWK